MDSSLLTDQEQVETAGTRPCSTTSARSLSCTTCTKAKSKCVRYNHGDDACRRCARLGKECLKKQPVKRKRRPTKITRANQLRNLEDKIEKIAVTLSSQQGQNPIRTTGSDAFPRLNSPQTWGYDLEDGDESNVRSRNTGLNEIGEVQQHHDQQSLSYVNSQPSTTKTDILLDRYQRLLAPFMPFVVLSAGTTASTLAITDPFLLKAITVVAHFHDTTEQQSMANDLVHDLAEQLLIKGEKTLGLLQGLLIFLNWYNPHLYYPKNHNNLFHLAMALTTDLNLDRGHADCEKSQLEAAAKAYGAPRPEKAMCNNERRALLGTFYLTSSVSSSFRRIDHLSWTAWHTQCTRVLEESEEYESDQLLLQLIQMQRIIQDTMTIEDNSVPIKLFANTYLDDLARVRVTPGNGALNAVAGLQQACTRVAIWQRSFAGLASDSLDSSNLRQRLDGMWHCMESTKEFMEIYMELPVENYVVFPFTVFAQFAYAFVVIIRALSLDLPGWDMPTLREYTDFSSIMENAASRFEQITGSRANGVVLDNDGFARWATRIRWAKAFYDAKIIATSSKEHTNDHIGLGCIEGNFSAGDELAQPPMSNRAMDSWLDAFVNLEDFWNGFDYDAIQSTDFGLNLNDM